MARLWGTQWGYPEGGTQCHPICDTLCATLFLSLLIMQTYRVYGLSGKRSKICTVDFFSWENWCCYKHFEVEFNEMTQDAR